MTLYLYKTGTSVPAMVLDNVVSYAADQVVTEEGCYGPFADDYELSAAADCTETLRADYRRENPSAETRLEELEEILAELLFGGEAK